MPKVRNFNTPWKASWRFEITRVFSLISVVESAKMCFYKETHPMSSCNTCENIQDGGAFVREVKLQQVMYESWNWHFSDRTQNFLNFFLPNALSTGFYLDIISWKAVLHNQSVKVWKNLRFYLEIPCVSYTLHFHVRKF